MDKKLDNLYEICETLSKDLEETNAKIRKAGGKLTVGDLDYADKLTHALKSVKTTIAMMEAEDGGGYSGRFMPYYGGMSYRGGGGGSSYEGGGSSYARGQRRDSRGRYSRESGYSREGGYSYADGIDGLMDEMRGMMGSMPEEKRREVERFLDKMERM